MSRKQFLGKGLSALLEENNVEIDEKQVKKIPISSIEPNKNQPRRFFDQKALNELAESIKKHDVLEPIIVRQLGDNYQIVSGERRWRASRIAGLETIPAIVRDYDDKTALEIAMIENLQREDLNVVEEARGYKQLMDEYSLTQEGLASLVNKSRENIANTVRLLKLPEEILTSLEKGDLTASHARALLPLVEKYSTKDLENIYKRVLEGSTTVRELEQLNKNGLKKTNKKIKKDNKDIYIKQIEADIGAALGRKINISKKRKKGVIEIEYYSKEDFENLVQTLKKVRLK